MITAVQVYNKERSSDALVHLFQDECKLARHLKSLVKDEFYHSPGELDEFLSAFGLVTSLGIVESSDYQVLEDDDDKIDFTLDRLTEDQLCEFYNTLTSDTSFVVVHRGLEIQ